jgi:predicted acylesterase/phospholipase RssA
VNVVSLVHLVRQQARALNRPQNPMRLYEAAHRGEYYVSPFTLKQLAKKKIPHQVVKHFTRHSLPVDLVYPARSFLFDAPEDDALFEGLAFAMSKHKGKGKVQLQYLGRRRDENSESFTLDRPGGKRNYQWRIPSRPEKVVDIRDQFPKIVRRIKDKNTTVILSFGSGGVRLFAHPSLMKFIDIMGLRDHIDEIWGSSGGAIAGLPYSLGVDPMVIEQEGYHLFNDRYSIRLSPSKFEVIKNMIIDAFLPASDAMLEGFVDCQNQLRELLQKHLKVIKKQIPFFCVAYNLKQRRNEVLTPEKIDSSLYRTPILHTDALDAVIASSAIPILYVPKKILRGNTEHAYIDGGTTEEVPLISPYRKWVRDRKQRREKRKKLLLISVNLFPEVGSSTMFSHWVFKRIPALKILHLSATYADLVRQARIDEQKGTLSRDANVTQWELFLPPTGGGVVNTKVIPTIIETAQKSFYEQLRKIEGSLVR